MTDFRTNNHNTGIAFLKKQANAPEYVRSDDGKGASDVFAHPVEDLYPCSTRSQTWHSYAFLKTADHGLSPSVANTIEDNLRQAAGVLDMDDALCAIDMAVEAKKEAAKQKETPGERYWALTLRKSAESKPLYPLNTPAEVQKSARAVINAHLPIEWMKSAAVRIVERAVALNIPADELPERIVKLGTACDFDEVGAMALISPRLARVDEETGALYAGLVKAASEDTSRIPECVELMLTLDRDVGFNDRYPAHQPIVDPYTVFEQGPPKAALEKAAQQNVLLADTLVPVEEFQNLEARLHQRFAKKAAARISELIKQGGSDGEGLTRAISALPTEVQRNLLHLLAQS